MPPLTDEEKAAAAGGPESAAGRNAVAKAFLDKLYKDRNKGKPDKKYDTVCIFIPYHKFSSIPTSELRKIKQKATLSALKPFFF